MYWRVISPTRLMTSPTTVVAKTTCMLYAIAPMSPEDRPTRAGLIAISVPTSPRTGPILVKSLERVRSFSQRFS